MTHPPGTPLAMADFFALEAGEYLERLDALLAPEGPPAADDFVRLARALRGSALMASQTPIARTAAGLESLARSLREGRRGWDPGTRQIAIRTVDDLKILIRRVATWAEADTAKAEALARELEQVSGRPSAVIRQAEALGLDAGARAFVAREGAAIASALDRAATALRGSVPSRDPLQHVLRTLQPLRGLAALNDLPPLPDVLEGIERAVNEVLRGAPNPPAAAPDFFQHAGAAIAQAAREVAERGKPDPEGPAFRGFAGQLARFFDREPAVIPISDLYFDDVGPHIVQRGAGAAQAAPLSRMELVSHGEHLRLAADAIERAPSVTQRELRVHTLAGTFRALAVAGEGPLPKSLSRFVDAAREAVALGHAVQEPARFASALRQASEILAMAGVTDDDRLADGLAEVAHQLHTLAAPAAPPAPPPTLVAFPGAQPLGSALDAAEPAVATPEGPIVRIEDLELSEPVEMALSVEIGEPVEIAEPIEIAESIEIAAVGLPVLEEPAKPAMPPLFLMEMSETPAETPDIVGSWIAYERMVAAGIGPASLEELMGEAAIPAAPTSDTARPPAPSFAAAAPAAPTVEALPVVDVQTLLYRGERALARVQELRDLARRSPPDLLPALFDEVCDLVDLAIQSGA
jgi:HPt (histidine-containing phosphotransfer) domain-containing protein